MRVLVINSGSSSVKYSLYAMEREALLVSGAMERIGEHDARGIQRRQRDDGTSEVREERTAAADHAAALEQVFALLTDSGILDPQEPLHAIGHRVVHGGEAMPSPALIDDAVIEGIRATIPLAPLHNPACLAGIETMRRLCPSLPQVAVFDTAFFRTLPPQAYRYALPETLYREHGVRRYGFHGTSHQYIAAQAAAHLQQPPESMRLVTLHLGNGASAAAIRHGVCIDTSMGMTPLAGLIMGTRCGDLDPSIHFYLARTLGMTPDEIESLLNEDSGMQGLCGTRDMREVHRLADSGDAQASLALDMYCYRICKYVGAYYAVLGGMDALVFTAGVGENDSRVRQSVCDRLAVLGISLDHGNNRDPGGGTRTISTPGSRVQVVIVPANEELEIARQTMAVLAGPGKP
ncbi:MAG: acetate kinase [Gammaproteobacteria bacterium]|jgi:acetate kinase